jgi:hypothetical protein
MTWSWVEIEQDWLAGGVLAEEPDAVVEAFDRVEEYFGHEWMEQSRMHEGAIGPARGTSPTLNITILGQELAMLEVSSGCETLVQKLRDRVPSASAELDALWLAGHGQEVDVECEPEVDVAGRLRKPDFRIRPKAEAWTFVEVTQPNRSAAEMSVRAAMDELVRLIETSTGTYTAEVFFLRLPEQGEIAEVLTALADAVSRPESREITLSDDLGVIYLHVGAPGEGVIDDHGFPSVPRLGAMRAAVENGEPVRHVMVRMPYYDQRGHQFLATEASQLPEDAPGLIMIQTSAAPGALKEWVSVIEGELQLGLYEQVSAVCLFGSGHYPTDRGEVWRVQTKLVGNPDALHELPDWLHNQLRQFEGALSS